MHQETHLGKALLIQKSSTRILAFCQRPSATPGKTHRNFSTSSFTEVTLCKQQCWAKIPQQLTPGGANPASRNLRSSAVLKRGRGESHPKGLPGLVASNKIALQTLSKGCIIFLAFSLHSTSLLQTLYRQHHNQIPWGLKTFASSISLYGSEKQALPDLSYCNSEGSGSSCLPTQRPPRWVKYTRIQVKYALNKQHFEIGYTGLEKLSLQPA